MEGYKPKSFWKKPEGKTGAIVGIGILGLLGYGAFLILPFLTGLVLTTLQLTGVLVGLGALLYMVLDPKMRTLVWYGYKSVMRWITSLFIRVDPMGILKTYVADLKDNLKKMNRQINSLRGQMHKLGETIHNNKKQIVSNLELAGEARDQSNRNQMILKSRKAGRLKESNLRLEDLYKKMEVLYRVLSRMYANSQIMMEDLEDQVSIKEQEAKAIYASHSAMRSAMNVIKGDKDKRAMFDQALEAIADDVGNKVGEMERFMELSSNFMDSIDLQNGVYEENGLQMLETWEKETESLILGDEKSQLLMESNDDSNVLDLNEPIKVPERAEGESNQYDRFFD